MRGEMGDEETWTDGPAQAFLPADVQLYTSFFCCRETWTFRIEKVWRNSRSDPTKNGFPLL
jgi:hypothetical protein